MDRMANRFGRPTQPNLMRWWRLLTDVLERVSKFYFSMPFKEGKAMAGRKTKSGAPKVYRCKESAIHAKVG